VAALIVVGGSIYSIIRNEPFEDQNLVVITRIIISFSMAILGATVPGFLNLTWRGGGLIVRAGGALALFVLTFVYTPKVLPLGSTDVLLVELLHEDFNVRVNARWQLAQLGQTAVPKLTRILMAYPGGQYRETLGALSAFAAMSKEICQRALNENPELKDKIVSINRETKDDSIKKRAVDTLVQTAGKA
jgi:hypothetical protein